MKRLIVAIALLTVSSLSSSPARAAGERVAALHEPMSLMPAPRGADAAAIKVERPKRDAAKPVPAPMASKPIVLPAPLPSVFVKGPPIVVATTEDAGELSLPSLPAWEMMAMPTSPPVEMDAPKAWPLPGVTLAAAPAPTTAPTMAPTSTATPATPVAEPTAAPAATAPVMATPAPVASGEAPAELVRKLQRIQDRIASGDTEALAAQRALSATIDSAFDAAPPAVWQNPANARALVVYFLSGGSAAVLRRIAKRDPKPAIDPKILLGTLFYVEGNEEAALRELGEVDARSLPNNIGGQIALAQAALVVRNDTSKAGRLLALARLMMPGTLVEEGAMRRQILVAAQANDASQFERLSADYFFRFRQSAYADNFRQRFAAALVRMQFVNGPDGPARLEAMLKPLDDARQREIYLLMARTALLDGKTALAVATAERALTRAAPASLDHERAQLYLAAAQAATPDRFRDAAAALARIDRARLDPADAALVSAAIKASDVVRLADAPPVPELPAKTATDEEAKPAAAVSRTRLALQKIDGLLKQAPQ